MNRRKMTGLLAALICLAALGMPAMAAEVTGDEVYCFSPADFSADEMLTGICITEIPASEAGTMLLGSRVLGPGDILTVEQLSRVVFRPVAAETDRMARVTYLPIFEDRVEAAATMSVTVVGRTDEAPVAEDSAMETYRNLPNEAMLKVKDPEGEPMTYTLIRAPKRGDVVLREDGSFIYTPKNNKVGVDSFTYTATDPKGNVSREARVTVTVIKPSEAKQYLDTAGNSCRFAAEWMKNTGIFVGESFNGNGCFQPEKQVSRGDFLTMLVGVLEIPLEQEAEITGFTDDCAPWLKPYLAAAMRSGLTVGWPDGDRFEADAPITGAEAAVMLQNALDLAVSAVREDETVPAWARSAVSALDEQGICLKAEEIMTRGQAAEVMYRVHQLKAQAPGMRALQAAQ